ncbi:MAG TPA: outer membrane lipoprotein-sorting protein [Candidatus Methanoperedens sp.]
MIKRTGIVLLAIIVVSLISGCTATMSAEQIAQQMKEKQESIKDFSATMVTSYAFGDESKTAKAKIMNKMPDKSRFEYLEPAEMAGQIMVNDGKTIWNYDPKKNEVTRMDIPETERSYEPDYTQFIKEILNQTDISYQGTDKFEGRSVYLIKASPKDNSKLMGIHYRMWVDSETWMPLKIEIFDKNDKLMTSVEYRDIKFNTGIPDSEFEFKMPEGAKIVEREPPEFKQMTLEEARKEVNFTILSPSYMPSGYKFSNATVSKFDDKESVSLLYVNGSSTFVLTERTVDDTPMPDFGEVENVSINGAEGKLISMPGSNMLVWNNGDIELMLSTTFGKEETMKVAGSVK